MRRGTVASRLLVGTAVVIAVCVGTGPARAEVAVEKWRSALGFPRAAAVAPDGTALAQIDGFASPEALDVNRRDSSVWVADRAEPWRWRRAYLPERTVTRGQMAVYVARAFALPL